MKNEANDDNTETTDTSRTDKDDTSRTNRDDFIEIRKPLKKYYDDEYKEDNSQHQDGNDSFIKKLKED